MPLVAFSIKLSRIDEALLYQDPGGKYWLSGVCTLDRDAKDRLIVAQSIPPERYKAGERAPAIGTWREIGKPKPPSSGGKNFDLAKYKAAAQPKPPQQGAYPQGQESRFSSPQAAFDAAKDHQQEPRPTYPQGLDEPGF